MKQHFYALCQRVMLGLVLVTLSISLGQGARAATFSVTLTTDTGATNSTVTPLGPGTAGDLRNAIYQADQSPGTANVIDLTGVSGTITLRAMLPPLFTTGTGSLLIIGPGATNLTISGNNLYRPFFIVQGSVGIANVTIANGKAKGGTGGGGGAGLGGGLLIDGTPGATTVTLTNVTFNGNSVLGGQGGTSVRAQAGGGGAGGNGGNTPCGGGGGFLGNGGNGYAGGGGFTGNGGGFGGNGTIIGGGGGDNGLGSTGGGNGGSNGGGGGGSSGFAGSSSGADNGATGGNGGFGGGGGGGNGVIGGRGGDYGGGAGGNVNVGGFGGGGGSGGTGAAGGFGGGGGGGNVNGGTAGTFGGNGTSHSNGGGGAGLGAALFQRAGTLYLINTTFTNSTATGGAGGTGSGSTAASGQGKGGALFINTGATAIALGAAPTFSGNTAANALAVANNPQDNANVYGTLSVDAGATLVATAGTPQSASPSTAFATALQATLKDGSSTPVASAVLPFSAPASGASATLSSLGGTTDASGQLSVSATANATAGSYTVTVGGGAFSASFALTNSPPPTVTGISPTTGPVTGGTSVTLTGTNFSGATAVQFGATNVTSFTVNSATSITCTAPASAAGTVDVIVTTAGGTSSTSANDQFTSVKLAQTISFATATPVTYGVAPITLTATPSSGLTASISLVSGPATLSGSTLTVTGAGNIVLDADQAGDATYAAATTVQTTILVNPATLTITANNAGKIAGSPNPLLTAMITGFVNGDTSAVVSGAAALSTPATTNSSAGVYTITVAAGTLAAANYNFAASAYVNGALTVTTDLQITTQPANVSTFSGQASTLSVVAFGPALTYQWYAGISGDTSSPVTGANAASFTTPALTVTTNYWVRVESLGSTLNSTTAAVTVIPVPATTNAIGGSGGVVIHSTSHFSVALPAGSAATVSWNFSDGSTASGSDVTHAYTVPGTYPVTATVTEPSGQTTSQTFSVTVLPTAYRLTRGAIKLSSRGDAATLEGILYIPPGQSFSDLTINVDVGGNVATFAMNGKSRATSGGNTFSIAAKANGGDASFVLKLSGNLAAALKTNAPLDSAGLPTQVTVQIQYSSNYFSATLPVKFKVNASGAAAKF